MNSRMLFAVCMTGMVFSTVLTTVIFLWSRNDPGLRMAALVGASNIATALIAIPSILLTGKDVTAKHDPADLPPGSITTDKQTVQTPPIQPEVQP